MPKHDPKNTLEKWEVPLVKAMVATGKFNDQTIVAYFTRPSRSLNHARILEVRRETRHKTIKPASAEELAKFLATWPQIDWETGLHLFGDELIVKSREAMLLAVQAFNNPKAPFKAEVFIVLAVIAWTYLLHAYFKTQKIDYRYSRMKDGIKEFEQTKHGAFKYWELDKCLEHNQCPLEAGTKSNLKFLIAIRHEIEHQMTKSIDSALSAKLQACCINFNRWIKKLFGDRIGLDRDLALALQFTTFSFDQSKQLAAISDLPQNILALQTEFESAFSDEQYNDPNYALRVAFIQKAVNKKGTADQVVEFVRADSTEGREISRVLLKEVEKKKFKPAQIVKIMRGQGFKKFRIDHHSELWKELDARKPEKGFGALMSDDQWYWYENWLDKVREYCEKNRSTFA